MSKPSKADLLKKLDEVVDLYKKELQKIDPKTKLPGVLIDKNETNKTNKTLSASESLKKPVPEGVNPEKYDSCVDQVKEKSGKGTNPYAVCAASLKKEQHSSLSAKLKEALHKCGYAKSEKNQLNKDGSIQQGIAAAGGGGNMPINAGVSSALGGAFGKKSN